MIDPQVAWDKLSNFETAKQLAEYFHCEGIVGERGNAAECPIATWMRITTEMPLVTVSENIKVWTEEPTARAYFNEERRADVIINFAHTEATEAFMDAFDNKHFPELIDPSKDDVRPLDPCCCGEC